jgi:hypothetical protein
MKEMLRYPDKAVIIDPGIHLDKGELSGLITYNMHKYYMYVIVKRSLS